MSAALEKELAITKAALALAVALHDRLLKENRALKAAALPARFVGMPAAMAAPYGGKNA